MTQVKVRFISTAQRHPEEIVSGDKTVKEYLEEKGALMTAQFSINGAILSAGDMNMRLDETYTEGLVQPGATIQLYETAKTTGA